jgi:hypothetical protein
MGRRSIPVALFLYLTFCAGSSRADLSAGLVAYFPFSGGADDASGNGHDGTVYGATVTADRFGNASSAYSFDGLDDYIEVSNAGGVFNLTSAFTIAAWCQLRTSVPSTSSGPLIWKTAWNGDNRDTFGLALMPDDIWLLKIERASDDFDFNMYGSMVQPGRWYHVAATYDGQYMGLYIDGVLDVIWDTGPIVAYTGDAPLRIGSNRNSNHTPGVFDGIIDEVCIYNRALSTSEVRELSVVPLPGAALLGVLGLGYSGWRLRRRTT